MHTALLLLSTALLLHTTVCDPSEHLCGYYEAQRERERERKRDREREGEREVVRERMMGTECVCV